MDQQVYSYLNYRKSIISVLIVLDGEIFGNMKLMNDKREQFETVIE